jgi:pimeloyl-ACP methyl ester carboxylesterase
MQGNREPGRHSRGRLAQPRRHLELAQLLPNAPHRIATKSSHYVEIEEPQLVVEAARAEKPPR